VTYSTGNASFKHFEIVHLLVKLMNSVNHLFADCYKIGEREANSISNSAYKKMPLIKEKRSNARHAIK